MTSGRNGIAGEQHPARLAYLVAQVPAVHHTYLLREIRALRVQGFEVEVASISAPDRPLSALAPDEADEARRTFYVKSAGLAAVAFAHASTLLRHPARYLAGLALPLRLGRGHWRNTLYFFLYFVEAVLVGRWMERNGLAHAHVHYAPNVGLIMARIFPITVSFTFHGSGEFYDPEGTFLAEKVRHSLFSCAISYYGRSQLMRICEPEQWNKLEITPLGVDTALFVPPPARPPSPPVQVLCVGRLSAEKGHRVLLSAFARVAARRRDARLRFVGDGAERRALEAFARELGISELVVFEGSLNQPELRRVYSQSHIMVLPSFAEGVPVVLMEAMAMQLPCIATHITGIPELIQDGVSGLLVPASDDRELAEAMSYLIESPEVRERMGIAARERIIRDYDLSTNAARLAGVFRRRLSVPAAAEAAAADAAPAQRR